MVTYLKKIFPFEWKIKLRLISLKLKRVQDFSFKIPNQKKKRVFIFLAADYGNLGDVAITYAQHKFLNKILPDHEVTEIPISATLKGIVFVKRIIRVNDVITTVGGGNMGDLYPSIEYFRQLVIKNFPDNKIISFPQTVDFRQTQKGEKALRETIKIYSKHKNLTLLAREQKSYDFFIQHFKKNHVIMVPDIVFTLDKTEPVHTRKGVVLCLRDDNEKKMNPREEQILISLVNKKFKNYETRDTHIGGEGLSMLNRVKALHSIWDKFRASELVITDRLHGMIFCYITNTPAIVFLNNNHKIKSSYNWIKNAKHIHLMEHFSEEQILVSMETLKNHIGSSKIENMLLYYSDLNKLSIS